MNPRPTPLQWDIFCRVIDNFGDIGVCWRLSADLAARGHAVRLWVDDASALQWMAPAGCAGVQVLPWTGRLDLDAGDLATRPCEVLVEAFGCEVAPEFIYACAHQHQRGGARPVWINLEYLSAESYAERSHGLPSPVMSGPAAGWTKWFFYPGFSAGTGGLLREPGLDAAQSAFDAQGWLAAQGVATQTAARVSLFCYEPPALAQLLRDFAERGLEGRPVQLLVAAGRAARAVQALLPLAPGAGLLSPVFLPLLTQADFDRLLWACDLNFVRGEDSVIRAIWAGKPFVWQIYPQDDGVHRVKLEAFLDRLAAPASWRAFHHGWNAAETPRQALPDLGGALADWRGSAQAARSALAALPDLATALIGFAEKNR